MAFEDRLYWFLRLGAIIVKVENVPHSEAVSNQKRLTLRDLLDPMEVEEPRYTNYDSDADSLGSTPSTELDRGVDTWPEDGVTYHRSGSESSTFTAPIPSASSVSSLSSIANSELEPSNMMEVDDIEASGTIRASNHSSPSSENYSQAVRFTQKRHRQSDSEDDFQSDSSFD